jgi:hypothetical protein
VASTAGRPRSRQGATRSWLAIAGGLVDRVPDPSIDRHDDVRLALARFADAMTPQAPRGTPQRPCASALRPDHARLTSNHVGSRSVIFVWNGKTLRAQQPRTRTAVHALFTRCEAGPRHELRRRRVLTPRIRGGKGRCAWPHPHRRGRHATKGSRGRRGRDRTTDPVRHPIGVPWHAGRQARRLAAAAHAQVGWQW